VQVYKDTNPLFFLAGCWKLLLWWPVGQERHRPFFNTAFFILKANFAQTAFYPFCPLVEEIARVTWRILGAGLLQFLPLVLLQDPPFGVLQACTGLAFCFA